MSEQKKYSIGGLWLKTARDGQKYMSGNIEIKGEKHRFTVFKNKRKSEEKHPDYVIVPPMENKSPEPAQKMEVGIYNYISGEEIPF